MGFFNCCRVGLLGVVFLALSPSIYAADYTVTAESGSFYTRNVTPASQVRSQTTFAARAMVPTSSVVYTTRSMVYSRSTAASLLRFAASPAGLVTVSALQAFFEWWQSRPDGSFFDPETGEPMSGGQSGQFPTNKTYKYGQNQTAESLGAAISGVVANLNGATICSISWVSPSRVTVFSDWDGDCVPGGGWSGGAGSPGNPYAAVRWT